MDSSLVHEVILILLAVWQITNLTFIVIQLRQHRKECERRNVAHLNEIIKHRHALVEASTRLQNVFQPAVDAHIEAAARGSGAASVVPIRGQRSPAALKPADPRKPDSDPPSKPSA